MPRVTSKPTQIDFVLDYVFEDTPDEHGHVSFRQARAGEQRRLANLNAEQTQTWDDQNLGKIQLTRRWNPEDIKQFRVYLTLAGADLSNENGDPLFRLKEGRVSMAQAEFLAVWDSLPVELANELHQKCLAANPQWDYANPGE